MNKMDKFKENEFQGNSSPTNNTSDNTNKLFRFSKKNFNLKRELTLETPKNIIDSIPSTPNLLHAKSTEILNINTETKQHLKSKYLVNHKIFFNRNSKYENAKFSNKSYGVISSYGANTNPGQIRTYNEDRVSIILNVIKPNSRKNEVWPKVSFFGIYDGHGGNKCSDFLKENLHHYVCKEFNK